MSYNGSYGGASKGYDSEGNFISTITQIGITDTPQQVTFGAGGLSDSGNIDISATGILEVINSGYYAFKQRYRVQRTGAAGVSHMFFWAEISVDGGTVWNTIGNSVDVALDNSNETTVFFDQANLFLPAGIKLRSMFARSSTGNDSGNLIPSTPSAALMAAGAPVAPSAQITIYDV